MNDSLAFALLCLTSFFTLLSPLNVMPIFMTMTADMEPDIRHQTARKAVSVSFITLVLFAFAGQLIFQFFGITVNSLKIVGGVMFFLMGQDMLQARLTKTKIAEKEIKKYASDISVTPLAIPLICGPGAITNAIVLMEEAGSIVNKTILILSMLLICLITFIVLRNSSMLYRVLGETGNNVLMRLMGLILMVMAVEFFVGGAKPIIRDILHIS
ncbi:MarC family protein [Paenibacillus sp. MBLB4367]|uniref:MarC family protein n=1 Tax=Paenibacillus sp. MBLB4367 TaxID=3384767 RepID=UPI003907E800